MPLTPSIRQAVLAHRHLAVYVPKLNGFFAPLWLRLTVSCAGSMEPPRSAICRRASARLSQRWTVRSGYADSVSITGSGQNP